MRVAWLVLLLVVACDPPRPAPPGNRPTAKPAAAPVAAPVAPAAVTPPVAPPPVAPAAGAGGSPAEGDQDLRAEEPEQDPRSELVKVKLVITPAARGTVHWGRKKLADLLPGQMTVETERPRNTGPLDLLVRADGFLPHHVRLFTDRDDKLSVHLVRADQATGLLGYRRPPPATTAP
jgi:hypothetical protein